MQYTIRSIPEQLDKLLRKEAADKGTSLNNVIIETLKQAKGIATKKSSYRSLDHLFGTWSADQASEVEVEIKAQRVVDPKDWQ